MFSYACLEKIQSENVPSDICAKQRFRSACAFAVWSKSFLGAFGIVKDATSSSCEPRHLWSDCADAKADLSLRWPYMLEGMLSHMTAHKHVNLHILCSHVSQWRLATLCDTTEPLQIENNLVTYAISVDWYYPAHPWSLISVYAVRWKNV